MFGRDVCNLYIRNILWSLQKKEGFVEQYLGLFLTELGLFCHFVPGLLAIALGSRLPLFIWIAGIGLGTRLGCAPLRPNKTGLNWLKSTIKITRVVNLPLEFWTVGCRKLITWWPKEVVTWHKKVVMWFVWNGLPPFSLIREFGDAFHYAKDSENFGRNSNGKARFVFFWPEYLWSPLEVVQIFWPEYSDRNLPFHFWQTNSLP